MFAEVYTPRDRDTNVSRNRTLTETECPQTAKQGGGEK